MDEFDKLEASLKADEEAQKQATLARYQRDMNEDAIRTATDLGPDHALGVPTEFASNPASWKTYRHEPVHASETRAEVDFLPQRNVGHVTTGSQLEQSPTTPTNVLQFPQQ